MLIEREQDTSEYWRETEILTLVRHDEEGIDYEKCEQNAPEVSALRLPARRTVRPICRTAYELIFINLLSTIFQFWILMSKDPRFCVFWCLLFRERTVMPSEYRTYCDQKYGKWHTMFLPADYSQCRCCDERRSFRYELPTVEECPVSCRGYDCQSLVHEDQCPQGAFLPDKDYCNCCGRCSTFFQLNQKCAEFKKTIHKLNESEEIEIEEEFLEPGCDDGLVCRQGICQDTHTLMSRSMQRLKREQLPFGALEPCKQEMKYFKKKYGVNGHLHHEAPQCTPLWLYAPVQCRRFVCYCALEDGSRIEGIKVPRVEVSNMNCDCAREKCRTASDLECDGYGNYKEAVFMPHVEQWPEQEEVYESGILL
ncbi:hypothetical protein RR48_11293 [Papilio machaon]|uniref:Thyroglobulin type-1 domain-containing protein n=1 Tax=Papilio machaon TaxID=76193 RepID=A0A194QQG2_PAPMA|nr:hypothetical protein RR48_11293 [Papilio machaon]